MEKADSGLSQVIRDFRRDQVIDAARRLFGERGTIEVPMGDIATAAGVSRSTVYNYFSTREDVLAACLSAGQSQLVVSLQVALERAANPMEQLVAYLEVVIGHVDESPAFFRMTAALTRGAADAGEVAALEMDLTGVELGGVLRSVLQAGVDDGTFEVDDVDAARRFVGWSMVGLLHQRGVPDEASSADAARALVDQLVRGIGPAPRAAPMNAIARQEQSTMPDRYTVISADCHGGGAIDDYRRYLPSRLHDTFDAWRAEFVNPYQDLEGEDASRNWDSDRRLQEMEADGVVAEVIFPNTVPPFFPLASLVQQPPAASAGDLDLRWEGLRAHNRWLADFCAATPGRRAGIAQILLHDVDAAVAEVRWAAEAGLTGGVLLPGTPPGSGLPPLYAPEYEPLWSVCEELGLPLNHHTGSASPDYGEYPEAKVMFLVEATWWAHRALWQLIFAGVLERHPSLQLVFTEQGTDWLPAQLAILDVHQARMAGTAGSQEHEWGAEVMGRLSLKASEYWARQCHVGASFIRRSEVPVRASVGVDRIMWGSDFPHREGCWPFSTEHLRLAFADVPVDEVTAMVGGNAARVYGFDLDALAPIAAEVGPLVEEVSRPLDSSDIPAEGMRCPAFALAAAGR